MPRHDTDLPFGDAFGPNQLDTGDDREALAVVLEFINEYEGEEDAFDEAIIEAFFPDDDGTRAKNVRLGVKPRGYGIADENFEFTELGEELYELRDDPEKMYDRFARHILRNLHGLKGIEIVEDLRAQGKNATNANLKEEFRDQYGFHIDSTSNHWSQMRGWLSKTGIVNTGTHHYDIDRGRIQDIIGVDSDTILELDELNQEQQAFLRALALVDPDKPIKNVIVRKIAEEAYGVNISQSGISKHMLNPLQEAGYIDWEHVSGKPNLIQPTEKFESEVLKPILDDLSARTGAPRSVLRKSYEELLREMDSESTYDRGIALETLSVKLGRMIGLEFVGWRVRGKKTGGSEVDVIFDDLGPLYNRVQIQCKNTKSQLGSKHIAREVGIARMLQTTTILMIARGGLSDDAKRFANRIMQHENLAIVFLDGDDIEKLDEDPTHLLRSLQKESSRIHGIKRLGGREGVEEEDEEVELIEQEQQALEEFKDELSSDDGDSSLSDFVGDS